jgi:hypothetical protein
MSNFAEITKEAFIAIVGNESIVAGESNGGATIEWYNTKGMVLQTVTNYYSKAITQYYIRDINA